jgi:hypothetical protein
MRLLSIERATYWIMGALIFAIAARIPLDTDTWWHLRSAEHTLTQGMIYADPFSHTMAGERWINHSWGAQLVLYGAYRALGDAGLVLYTALLALGGMLFLHPILRGNAYVRAFLLCLAAATASVFWSARPQMFSFFFSAVTLFLLYRAKQGNRRALWWLVPMMGLWGNLHAGYSIGFIFMLAFFVGEAFNALFSVGEARLGWAGVRQLGLVALLSALALLVNPYGLDTWRVPFETVGLDVLRQYIQEWNSPNFQGRETWVFIGMVLLTLWMAWISRTPFDWTALALFAGTFFLALLYGRNIAVFAVAVVPMLSAFVDNALALRGWTLKPRPPTPRTSRLNRALVGVVWAGVAVYVLGAVLSPNAIAQARERFLPVKAVDFIRQAQPSGNMLNSYNWGGYLLFALPEYPVFVDGRTDLYGEFVREWLFIVNVTTDLPADLDRYGIGFVVVEKGIALDYALRNLAGWQEAYRDEQAVVYVRKDDA